jgi:branched-chain amino acid transport system substrate-binding protein
MPELALIDRGYKGKIYQTHAAATPDLIRLGGKAVEGTYRRFRPGPAWRPAAGQRIRPRSSRSTFVNKFEKAKFGANSRNQFAGHCLRLPGRDGKSAIPLALKKAKPGTPEFRMPHCATRLETMGRTVFSHGVMNWTAQRPLTATRWKPAS